METRERERERGSGEEGVGGVAGSFTLSIPSSCRFILFFSPLFFFFLLARRLCRSPLFARCHERGRLPRRARVEERTKRKGKVILMRIQAVCGAISCPLPRLMNARANIISAYVLANLE